MFEVFIVLGVLFVVGLIAFIIRLIMNKIEPDKSSKDEVEYFNRHYLKKIKKNEKD